MVGIVLVSHSLPLAVAAKAVVEAMCHGDGAPSIRIAAGAGDDHAELGTNAIEIGEAIGAAMSEEGVLVLVDMGSAVLSSEMAVSMLDEALQPKVRICAAPFVEGAVAAAVTAGLGGDLAAVAREAEKSLDAKRTHLSAPEEEAPSAAPQKNASSGTASSSVTVPLDIPHGLHARPAARLAREASRFHAEVLIENATTHKGPVPAASLSALASLEILQGHLVRIRATGSEAAEAIKSLRDLVQGGLGEKPAPAPVPVPSLAPSSDSGVVAVVPGIALGPVVRIEPDWPEIPDEPVGDVKAEKERLRQAVAKVRAALLEEGRKSRGAVGAAGAEGAEIFEAQAALLDDPALAARAEEAVTKKVSAAAAWKRSAVEMTERYRAFENDYFRQRATDVRDVGLRVLAQLGFRAGETLAPGAEGILVVDDITAAEALHLPETRISGVVCLDGGTTSHGAILLRALGIPAVARARRVLTSWLEGGAGPAFAALDGGAGALWLDPSPAERQRLEVRLAEERLLRAREAEEALQPARLEDGEEVSVVANVGNAADARAGLVRGAEGIGLLRTEFLFLDRAAAPSEEEQTASLRAIFDVMGDRHIVVRTLDAGGDKELPYLGLPGEENPFLGVRALRLCLRRPELFRTHLRALLRAGEGREIRIMFPMVSDVAEFRRAKQALAEAHESLRAEGLPHAWPVAAGTMIEIPSAALMAEGLAAEADFFSIGTNDLTQYTLAADRGNPELAPFHDALHPAVLALVQRVVRAAEVRNRPVAVCGEAAADPVAAAVLVGLGVRELSLGAASIPALKASLRGRRLPDLRALAAAALACGDAPEVRALARKTLSSNTAPHPIGAA